MAVTVVVVTVNTRYTSNTNTRETHDISIACYEVRAGLKGLGRLGEGRGCKPGVEEQKGREGYLRGYYI